MRHTKGWHKPFLTGYVWQKTYGVKVGHVVQRGKEWVAMFDGRKLGVFKSEDAAKASVDMAGDDWKVVRPW